MFGSKGPNVCSALTILLGVFLFFSTFSIAGAQTALAAAIVLWIILAIFHKAPRPGRTSLDIPILLFLAAWIVTVLFTERRWDNFIDLKNLLLMSIIYIFGFLVGNRREGRALATVLLFSSMAASIYAISIFLLGKGEGTLGRTPGTFSTAMTFGGVMLLLCSLFLAVSVGQEIDRKKRFAALLVSGLGLVALFFSFTRSSWLGMIASALAILAVSRRRLLVPFAVMLVILFIVLPGNYRNRVTSIWDSQYRTNVQRMELLRGGWNIFKDHPLVGVGSMDLAETYRRYKPPEAVHVFGHMHNIFLHVAVTKGLVGLIPFCFLLLSFVRLMVGNLRRKLPPPEKAWVVGSIGALIGFIVNGLFEWNFGDAEVVTLLYFIIGSNLAIALHRDGFADRSDGSPLRESSTA